MIQLESIQYKKNGTYGFRNDSHREPKYLVKFVICGIHSVILVLLFSVCERVSVCVCVCVCLRACTHAFFLGNVEFNKNEEIQLY